MTTNNHDRTSRFESFATSERLSPNALARQLDVHVSTVWRWLRQGVALDGRRVTLPARKVGGRVFILKSDAADFLDTISSQYAVPTPADQSRDVNGSEVDEQFCRRVGL